MNELPQQLETNIYTANLRIVRLRKRIDDLEAALQEIIDTPITLEGELMAGTIAERALGARPAISAKVVEALILARQEAIRSKHYELADDLQQSLLQDGVELEDCRDGTNWRRIGAGHE